MKNIKEYFNQFSDILTIKFMDTVNHILDTLQQYPISRGLVPSSIVAAPAFITAESIEYGLKIILLCLSILGAGLTAYAKYLHVKKLKNSDREN